MREHWDKAINEIDEKFVSEAAQAHAKNARRMQEIEQYEQETSRPLELKPSAEPKKSRKGMIIGLSAAAAAVVAVGIGGGIMLSRSDNDVLLPTDTPTAEATVEADDILTDEDGIIVFSQTYQEGSLTFEKPEISPATGASISVASSVTEMTDAELLAYIEGFTTVKADIPHENLLDNGFVFDKERSHYNGMASHAMGEDIGHQVSLVYRKGDAEIVVNYGETGQNYRVLKLPGDFGGKLWAGEKVSGMLRNYDNNGSSVVYCGGMVVDGVAYYAVTTYWYNEETDIRGTCVISAMGCDITDITDVLAGVICRSDMLHPVDVQPFSAADYQRIDIQYNDDEMQLTDSMIEALCEILADASSEPMYDGDDLDIGHDAQLMLYTEYPDGDTSILRLHKGGGKYYYSIADKEYGDRAYFELSEEIYDELWSWLLVHTPHSFIGTILERDGMNTSNPEIGHYLIKDNEGGVYTITSDKRFEIGDTVRVHYYGLVMDSIPAQVSDYDMTKAYNMPLDTTPLIPENAEEMGFDTDIFFNYFSGSWEDGYTLSYQQPSVAEKPICFEMEDGYFLGYYNNVAAEVYFIPKSCTETLFHYYVDDHVDASAGLLRNEGYTEIVYDSKCGVPDNSFPAHVNGFGEEFLFEELGESFRERYEEITDSYTDENGTVWEHHVSNLVERQPYVYLNGDEAKVVVLYSTADSIDEYWKVYDESVLVNQYFIHTIRLEGGEYQIVASAPCDEKGTVIGEAADSNKDTVTINSAFAQSEYRVSLEYIPVETETGIKITQPVLYIINPEGEEVWVMNKEDSVHFLEDVEMPKRSRVFLCEVQLDSGNAFAVMVPDNVDGKKVFHTTFLLYRLNKLYEFGDAFCPILSDTTIYYPEAEDVITVVLADGTAQSYHFNCDTLEASPSDIVANAGYNYIYFENVLNTFDSMSIAVPYFFGKWGNEDEVLTISLYESPFTTKDPLVGCYEDEEGYFMLGESRAWYIAKDDPEMLYYFDNVTDGQRIDTESCTASYQCLVHAENDGVYRGNGEMGYLGLLDLCYSIDYSVGDDMQIFDVSDFFDMEITDENGTRWVRTADRSVDWGGVYEIYINGERAHCLKMQNASDPSEFKYFSFFFSVSDGASIWEEQGAFRTESEGAVLTWTDEHYCFDLSVCNTKELPTEFAEKSETEATQDGHGYFVVEPYFYPLADGSYYAERVMGNNQAQWLSDTEIFYNDGSGYQLVNDEFNGTDTHSIGDKLYIVHNTEKGIGLSIYSGTELVDSIEIDDGGQIVQVGTWAKVRGSVLSIEYYDSDYFSETGGANVIAYYYTETGEWERIVLD